MRLVCMSLKKLKKEEKVINSPNSSLSSPTPEVT